MAVKHVRFLVFLALLGSSCSTKLVTKMTIKPEEKIASLVFFPVFCARLLPLD